MLQTKYYQLSRLLNSRKRLSDSKLSVVCINILIDECFSNYCLPIYKYGRPFNDQEKYQINCYDVKGNRTVINIGNKQRAIEIASLYKQGLLNMSFNLWYVEVLHDNKCIYIQHKTKSIYL